MNQEHGSENTKADIEDKVFADNQGHEIGSSRPGQVQNDSDPSSCSTDIDNTGLWLGTELAHSVEGRDIATDSSAFNDNQNPFWFWDMEWLGGMD